MINSIMTKHKVLRDSPRGTPVSPPASFSGNGILAALLPLIFLVGTAAAQEGRESKARMFVCMYEAPPPPPAEFTRIHPIYPGAAMSRDGGRTWTAIGWSTNRSNDLAASNSDTSLLYLAVDQGLLRSTDSGGGWRLLTDEEHGPALAARLYGDTLYLGAARGFFFSTDMGESWERRCAGLPPLNGTYVSDVLRSGDTLLIATADGVYSSGDAGNSWAASGLQGRDVKTLIRRSHRSNRLLAIGSAGELWSSADGGRDWSVTPAAAGGKVQTAMFDAVNENGIIVGTRDNGVLRSDDAGLTWRNISAGLTLFDITVLAADPNNPSVIYAGGRNGTFISENGGTLWRPFSIRIGSVSAIRIDR